METYEMLSEFVEEFFSHSEYLTGLLP